MGTEFAASLASCGAAFCYADLTFSSLSAKGFEQRFPWCNFWRTGACQKAL
jgi:hypothetical protein